MNTLLVLPILIPFSTGLVALFFWRQPRLQGAISVGGCVALLISSLFLFASVWQGGIQAVTMGDWPAPFGIALVADVFASMMVVLAGITGLAVAVYALANIDAQRRAFGYHTFFHILLMGVCGAFLTGDVFNLYVWFEVMLIASFVLLALGGVASQLEGAVKYVTLNLISSAFFLAAAGILYGTVGTLNMADASLRLQTLQNPWVSNLLAMLFLVAFGIKAAIFPLFFWLPASYHTPPVAVSAVFAGLLTKVGVYALVRVFTLMFTSDVGFTHAVILVLAGTTMISGVFGAMVQKDFRRILSFHIVSQIGYMIMGLGMFTPLALAGSVFYIAHHILVKTNLFLVSGVVHRLRGTFELSSLGGLYRSAPLLSVVFLIPALSLAGIPPLSGFWAKFVLVQAGINAGGYTIVAVALVGGILTLFSMTKIWGEAFWKKEESGGGPEPPGVEVWTAGERVAYYVPIIVLAALTVSIGLTVAPLMDVALRAAAQLADPAAYVAAVLAGRP
ncbi:MAG: Na+/H+ antiporter subunit D [Bacteroidetes bacterium]|nr:Na+/H+ antiporter subunit D [Bacteroidota bacterium]